MILRASLHVPGVSNELANNYLKSKKKSPFYSRHNIIIFNRGA